MNLFECFIQLLTALGLNAGKSSSAVFPSYVFGNIPANGFLISIEP
jgi:hypothetical protein